MAQWGFISSALLSGHASFNSGPIHTIQSPNGTGKPLFALLGNPGVIVTRCKFP